MLYHAYEMTHAAIAPLRSAARMSRVAIANPLNPMRISFGSRTLSAALEVLDGATRRYHKPGFELGTTRIGGVEVPVFEEVVWSRPFCNLVHFRREGVAGDGDPKLLIVAPMSGHHATLLRSTVEAMLPEHDVYVTDWVDARDVPLAAGRFDLDDYVDHLVAMCRFLAAGGERPALMAVCQPGVPALAAASLMAARDDPARPSALVLMGSPVDPTRNPTQANRFATSRPLGWFEHNLIVPVPWPNRGFMRRVYPGFLQLSGFMSMNLDRHVNAHVRYFGNLVRGHGDNAAAHRRFYDEYLAVMDLTSEFYLQTIERVFQKALLARGAYRHRGEPVEPAAISDIAVMTVEGEKDDITGLGQTEAAHDLLANVPEARKLHHVATGVGHYGIFNGSRWRSDIRPRVQAFIRAHRDRAPGAGTPPAARDGRAWRPTTLSRATLQ